jgi:GDP/UDP-N,N'-diacetylbacillosamine 2-epimerase (hydrolysing)
MKICVLTGSRADYGLLKNLMKLMLKDPKIELNIISTGTHESEEFGLTRKFILKDGFEISRSIPIILSADTDSSVGKSTGMGIILYTEALKDLKPDYLLILGDRFEILAGAVTALFLKIPIIHLHGGELTLGAFDDAIRHSISKMSSIHFVANSIYKNRLIKMGEDPKSIYNFGGLGVDAILRIKKKDKSSLEKELIIEFSNKNILVTFHPTTLEEDNLGDLNELIESLSKISGLEDTSIFITASNADTLGRHINDKLKEYSLMNKKVFFQKSLGNENYISLMSHCDAVIGNSSSGLLEAPTLNVPTINIGSRQEGRLRASSVIDVLPKKEAITEAFKKSQSRTFQKNLKKTKNPYGKTRITKKILNTIKKIGILESTKKGFYES